MDLRSIINTEAADNSAQKPSTPITPVQPGPSQHSFREYHPSQAVGKHPIQEFGHRGSDPYPLSSTPFPVYQRPSAPTPLQPPPPQSQSHNDIVSPASSHYSVQSPYPRNTPTSSVSAGQYPFPPNPTPQSPAQPHPYPQTFQHRDSYPQSHAPQPQHLHQPYAPAGSIPSPLSTPGSANQYFSQSQRSQSSHSNTTPTSAQSQQPYYNQYPHDSPVSVSTYPKPHPQHTRQPSQPQTPIGHPMPSPRQNSGSYTQPTSPYQQRPPSSGAVNQAHSLAHSVPQQSPLQQSPPQQSPLQQSPPQQLQQQLQLQQQQQQQQNVRYSSADTTQDSRQTSVATGTLSNSGSQSVQRERSVSVSPKSQLPTLPMAINEVRQVPNGEAATPKRGKRNREVSDPELTTKITNGTQPVNPSDPSLQQSGRKRVKIYPEPPIWAQSFVKHAKEMASKQYGAPPTKQPINRRQPEGPVMPEPPVTPDSPVKPEPPTKPEPPVRSEPQVKPKPPNGHHQAVHTAARPPQVPQASFPAEEYLGLWEPSIMGVKPYEEMTKLVADWLFMNVVTRPDGGELVSRGVQIEIEAKLGQLINRDTNERIKLPVVSECILASDRQISFRSSMTEAQHKSLNDFLNAKVQETHPENPNRTKPRVPILYHHRHEQDTFYELPLSAQKNLPPAIRDKLNPKHTVKVRVTRDQKSGELLATIIKTRVADLDIYNPSFPLDCRISVNLEMRYDGDLKGLVVSAEPNRMPGRIKNRLSYTQSHYQIDLTQVTVADSNSRDKEHELEIEVSATAVRDQGLRAVEKLPHQYRELIEGFMDNVRVLARVNE